MSLSGRAHQRTTTRLADASTFSERENLGHDAGICRPNSGKTVVLYDNGTLETENERLEGEVAGMKEILAAQTKTQTSAMSIVVQQNTRLQAYVDKLEAQVADLQNKLNNNNGGETEEKTNEE